MKRRAKKQNDPLKVLLAKRRTTKQKYAKENKMRPDELHWLNGVLLFRATGKPVKNAPRLINEVK